LTGLNTIFLLLNILLASESQHKGSNTPFISRAVVNENRMRPKHHICLKLVLSVPFSVLTLTVEWLALAGYQVHKTQLG